MQIELFILRKKTYNRFNLLTSVAQRSALRAMNEKVPGSLPGRANLGNVSF